MEIFHVGRPKIGLERKKFTVLPEHETVFINTQAEAEALIARLPADGAAMDTETVFVPSATVNPLTQELRVISIAIPGEYDEVNRVIPADEVIVIDVRDLDKKVLADAFMLRAAELGVQKLQFVGLNNDFDDPVTTLNLYGDGSDRGEAYRPLLFWKELQFAYNLTQLGAPVSGYPSLGGLVKKFLGYEMDGKDDTRLSYDADSDLTEEQIRYAGDDALLTLWLADALEVEISRRGLNEVFTLECMARPFLQSMSISGLRFDKDAWMEHLEEVRAEHAANLSQLAELTGGGQMSLDLTGSGGALKPQWNPNSAKDLKYVLNTYCSAPVREYMIGLYASEGASMPLGPKESVDKTVINRLLQISKEKKFGCVELLEALLKHSDLGKTLSTYGDNMMNLLGEDGRFHSRFTQCQVATGRTSSSKPNAQNFAPAMKPFFRPGVRADADGVEHKRVLLHADYSQAELRVAAELTGEPVRVKAFQNKEDQHVAVATVMWDVDMKALLESGDPVQLERFDRFRSSTKSVSFGLQYGMTSKALAKNLTDGGRQTSPGEAQEMIDDYYEALPTEYEWLVSRDYEVDDLARNIQSCVETLDGGVEIDFRLSRKIATGKRWKKATAEALKQKVSTVDITSEEFRDALTEIVLAEREDDLMTFNPDVDPTPSDKTVEDYQRVAMEAVADSENYETPVILRTDGRPYEFTSKTIAGRQRHYQVTWKIFEEKLATQLATSPLPDFQKATDIWGEEHGLVFAENPHTHDEMSKNRKELPWREIARIFDGKDALRSQFVKVMLRMAEARPARKGTYAKTLGESLQRSVMARVVRSFSRQYRNAPIQGTVADAAQLAFGRLQRELLTKYPTAVPVITVHDSIAIEVDASEAHEAGADMQRIMEEALQRYVRTVPVVADLDILNSLSTKDVYEG